MNKLLKMLLLILVLGYIVSPADFCPGPIDDAILLLLSWAMNQKKLNS